MRVLSVKYLEDYKLEIEFSNGTTKTVDFEEKLQSAKGIFLPLKKLEYFKQVSVDDCCASICWPNGADICPDVLYAMGETSAKPKKKHKRTSRTSKRVSKIRKKTQVKIS